MKVNRMFVVSLIMGIALNAPAVFAVAHAPQPNLVCRTIANMPFIALALLPQPPNVPPCKEVPFSKTADTSVYKKALPVTKNYRVGHERSREAFIKPIDFEFYCELEESIKTEKALLANIYKKWFKLEKTLSKRERKQIKELCLDLDQSINQLSLTGEIKAEDLVVFITKSLPMLGFNYASKNQIFSEKVMPFLASEKFLMAASKPKETELFVRETVRNILEDKIKEKINRLINDCKKKNRAERSSCPIEFHKPFKPSSKPKLWIDRQITEGLAGYLAEKSAAKPAVRKTEKPAQEEKLYINTQYFNDSDASYYSCQKSSQAFSTFDFRAGFEDDLAAQGMKANDNWQCGDSLKEPEFEVDESEYFLIEEEEVNKFDYPIEKLDFEYGFPAAQRLLTLSALIRKRLNP